MVPQKFRALSPDKVKLGWSTFSNRYELNREYLASLKNKNLLQNHYIEAGLWAPPEKPSDDCHWGWESPTCQLRGHFVGHWIWSAAYIYRQTGDQEFKARLDKIVDEIAKCQIENGDGWAGSIPSKYIDWAAKKKYVWAPYYTLHKNMFGLIEAYKLTGNEKALDIVVKWAKWFTNWTNQFTKEQMDDILDVETGGMMEAWADLYGITGDPEHLALLRRFERSRLWNRLLAGEDALLNMHANTTIPEIMGVARSYEVTGDERYRQICEAYWKFAVDKRGFYATGGQTHGEVWSPQFELSARLGEKTQEHCTVYHMIRFADYLYKWTGDVKYLDYIERNLWNGILAQQNPTTGMVTYFLPLHGGAQKKWGTPTDDFWCCHATLVQAHVIYNGITYFEDEEGFVVGQYIPASAEWEWKGVPVKINQMMDWQKGEVRIPKTYAFDLTVDAEKPVEFTLKIRLPWWLSDKATITVNGEPVEFDTKPSSYASITRTWGNDKVHVSFPKKLVAESLPDNPNTVAFVDGPVLMAGLVDEERTLIGDKENPEETMFTPDAEREWGAWKLRYRTKNQEHGIRFIPLYEVVDQKYSVYFPVKKEK